MQVIERTEEHYEVREVEFGKVYGWRPGSVVIECDCGERQTLTASAATCSCGADHATVVGRELVATRLKDEELHPWRYSRDREETKIPF